MRLAPRAPRLTTSAVAHCGPAWLDGGGIRTLGLQLTVAPITMRRPSRYAAGLAGSRTAPTHCCSRDQVFLCVVLPRKLTDELLPADRDAHETADAVGDARCG